MKYHIIEYVNGARTRSWVSYQEWLEACRNRNYYLGELRVLLLFMEKEVQDDVQRNAVVQGRPRQKEARENNKSVAQFVAFQEVAEPENWEWCRRVLGMAVSEIESVLYIATRSRMTGNRTADNRKERTGEDGEHHVETSEYCIELHVSDNFSDTTVTKLLRTSQDYIVARILWEWANMTCPEFAEIWERKMKADMEELKIESRRLAVVDEARIVPSWII